MASARDPIPQEWIKQYVDKLLEGAAKVGPETVFGKAIVLRADHVLDLVQAFREHG